MSVNRNVPEKRTAGEFKVTEHTSAAGLVRAITGGVDYEYRELIRTILRSGVDVTTRGHKCKRLINYPVVFSSTPLISLRTTAWKSSLREWEWFMSGSNRLEDLHPSVRHWWAPWAKPNNHPQFPSSRVEYNYSQQFRFFFGEPEDVVGGENSTIDQIKYLVDGIRNHPYSRRNLITTWNTCDMAREDCPITNCHGSLIQAFVDPGTNKLSLLMVQRSADVICGVPHNWFQYWGFLLWLAHVTGRGVGEFHWIGTDCHIYEQHMELAERIAGLAIDPIVTPELVYNPGYPAGKPLVDFPQTFLANDFSIVGDYSPILTDRAEMVV